MAFIRLYRDRLASNYRHLDRLFAEHDKEWAVVSKMLCGNRLYLAELIRLGASSDMIVLDLGDDKDRYRVGDLVSFRLIYMGALALLNSDYIEKVLA